ncbi:hypothetical protein LTR01_008326 [Friedmanniomyces endolithicus]|nr:hypothetical protein LTR01_008326 [Friedmanniomyces endolithicus]KAK0825254.1 hypothetical protein LTR73_007208 [Friedmanniomyces endolithicus]
MCAFAYVLQRSKVRTASLNHVQYGIFDAGLQCSTTLLSLLLHPENLDPKYSCETHLPRNPDPQPLKNGYPSGRKAPPIMEPSNTAIRTVHLETFKTTSVSRVFHPTTAQVLYRVRNEQEAPDRSGPEHALLWRARDQRKGRGAKVAPVLSSSGTPQQPPKSQHLSQTKQIIRNIARIFTTFPYRDTAFWSAWSYTIGSALFIIVSAFAWAPLAYPRAAFAGEQKYGVPLSFFLGALFFQLGAVVAYLEAVNTVPSHGIAMGNMLDGRETGGHEAREEALHALGTGWKCREGARGTAGLSIAVLKLQRAPGSGGVDAGEAGEGSSNGHRTWRWWPTWHALRTFHTYEIGYLACSFQLLGATLYCAVAVVIMPGILDSLDT